MRPEPRGSETILLVEDEKVMLQIATAMLERLGYNVYSAATVADALAIANENISKISLIITDVVMPEMNGRDLFAKLQALKPGLKCLFMSGYTANVIASHGILQEGVFFIQKPFSAGDLSVKVREALG